MRKLLLVYLFPLLALLSGCATSTKTASTPPETATQPATPTLKQKSAEADFAGNSTLERKVLFSALLHLTVKNPDTANMKIASIADRYNGYISEVGTYKSVIRVESKFLNSAISDISNLGKVQSKELQGQDVTEQFLDYQTRLENAVKAREKYLELLEDAETVEEAILVEKELERLNETIEFLKGKINRIDHLEEFSTITIFLKEKRKPGVIGYIALGLYYSVKWLFVRN